MSNGIKIGNSGKVLTKDIIKILGAIDKHSITDVVATKALTIYSKGVKVKNITIQHCVFGANHEPNNN